MDSSSQWREIKPPIYRHGSQTATLLKDGRVLILAYDKAEVFDPVKERWAEIAPPLFAHRSGYSACLLNDGRVFFTGGGSVEGAPLGAGVYDPDTNKWKKVFSPGIPSLSRHQTTVLRDGRVLLSAGGIYRGEKQYLKNSGDCFLWNPLQDQWTTAPPLQDSRKNHSAALLPDGTVIVTAGTRTTERWIPESPESKWEFVGPITTKGIVFEHSFVVLKSGAFLVIGGSTESAIVPYGSTCDRAQSDLLNLETLEWSKAGTMSETRRGCAAVTMQDGSVLVIGGINPRCGGISSCEIWDPETHEWRAGPELNRSRYFHSALCLLDGRVLVVGGDSHNDAHKTAEILG